jgi:glycosyltransferase involved in cell wall biosynthesis
MRIAFLDTAPVKPNGQGGGAVTSWALVRHLLAAGHDLVVIHIGQHGADHEADHVALKDRGVDAIALEPPPAPERRKFASLHYRLALARWRRRVAAEAARAVSGAAPDLCFVFADAIHHSGRITGVPMVAHLTHTGEPFPQILADLGRKKVLGSVALARLLVPLILAVGHRRLAALTDRLVGGICPSHYYADIYRRIVVRPERIASVDHPAEDESGDLTVASPASPPANTPCRVAIIGHLKSTFSLAALTVLVDQILPEIDRRGLAGRFEFRIVGRFAPPVEVADRLNRPDVTLCGYVDNLADEVNRADAVLQAMPYPPGAGMRLSTLSALYPCLVLHRVVGQCFPEFVDGQNCLLAWDGPTFVEALTRACDDRTLSGRLRIEARKTYERLYRPEAYFQAVDKMIASAVDPANRPKETV